MLLILYDVLLEEIASWIGVTCIHLQDVCKRLKNLIPGMLKNLDQQEVLIALVRGHITPCNVRFMHKLQPFTIKPSLQIWDYASTDINVTRCLMETFGFQLFPENAMINGYLTSLEIMWKGILLYHTTTCCHAYV